MSLTDEELLAGVEACTLPAERFGHEEHLRLAWIVLQREEPTRALTRIASAIRAFAAAAGRPQKYHATITWAFVALIAERMERTGRGSSWRQFAADNPDLSDRRLLGRYYDRATLGSDLARRTFVLPERR